MLANGPINQEKKNDDSSIVEVKNPIMLSPAGRFVA